MPTTLLACPFCGSRSTAVRNFRGVWFVVCRECHADGPAKYTRKDACTAWNERRAPKSDGDGNGPH